MTEEKIAKHVKNKRDRQIPDPARPSIQSPPDFFLTCLALPCIKHLTIHPSVKSLTNSHPFSPNSSSSTNSAQHQHLSSYTLLASCMHAGSRVVQLSRSGDEWEFAVLAKFEEHKSMNYGSDVQPLVAGAGGVAGGDVEGGEQQQQKRVIVSASFYDKLMCVWSF
jgi:hypothetical protein